MIIQLRIGFMCLALIAGADSARASLIVDQQQLLSESGIVVTDFATAPNGANGLDGAQTFTVGVSGQLVQVDVPLWRFGLGSGLLLFDIRPTTGGIPVESDLSSLGMGSVSSAVIPTTSPVGASGWTSLNLEPFNIQVTEGQVLALALRAQWDGVSVGGLNLVWNTSGNTNPYANGAAFLRGSNASNVPVIPTWSLSEFQPLTDHAFVTYVEAATVPEPSSLIVFGIGAVTMIGGAVLRRHR